VADLDLPAAGGGGDRDGHGEDAVGERRRDPLRVECLAEHDLACPVAPRPFREEHPVAFAQIVGSRGLHREGAPLDGDVDGILGDAGQIEAQYEPIVTLDGVDGDLAGEQRPTGTEERRSEPI
jgi:hypothetical protein